DRGSLHRRSLRGRIRKPLATDRRDVTDLFFEFASSDPFLSVQIRGQGSWFFAVQKTTGTAFGRARLSPYESYGMVAPAGTIHTSAFFPAPVPARVEMRPASMPLVLVR